MTKFFFLATLFVSLAMTATAQVEEDRSVVVSEIHLDGEDSATLQQESGADGMAKATTADQAKVDLNGDNVLNVIDIVDLIRYLNNTAGSNFLLKNADVNGDKMVDFEDVKALSLVLTGGEVEIVGGTDEKDDSGKSGFVLRGDTVSDPTFK